MRALEPLSRDYEVGSPLVETGQSRIFRGKRLSDGQPVIIKTLRLTEITPENVFRLRREYGTLMELSIEGVIRIYDLREMDGVPALVLEYFEGSTLQQYLTRYPQGLPLKVFFPIAIHITSTLMEVHKRGILHLDLKPGNILLSSRRVCLTDFGISQPMGGQTEVLLEGSLPYMSPEQTGRTAFSIDQRSDLYSLGVILYEMLSGKRPLQASDMSGWVHAHLAQKPQELSSICSCPATLQAIIMKLLEKDPAQRYQSAAGLLFDLHRAYQSFQKTGTIESFPIATRDFPQKLIFSTKPYGRKEARDTLAEALRRSLLGSFQHIVVIGESGIGKTFLVDTLIRDSQNKDMWRIRVSFSRERQTTPYHGLRQFLYDMLQQFSMLPASEQKHLQQTWQEMNLPTAVLSTLFGDIEKVFPSSGSVEVLDQEATKQRLLYVFGELVRMIVSRKRPLLLVLDHIQWADRESLDLFVFLARQNISFFCLISLFQGSESTWQEFSRFWGDTPLRTVVVTPWTIEDVLPYLSTLLSRKETELENLSRILLDKTQGNPRQWETLLTDLFQEGLLFIDGYRGWRWKEQEIASYFPAKTGRALQDLLSSLNEDHRRILALASCIGNRFSLSMMQEVVGVSEEELLSLLAPLLDHKLLTFQGGMVVWTHPDTREALSTALNEEERAATHYLLGMFFLQQGDEVIEDKIYFVLEHLLKGLSRIDPATEKDMVLDLIMKFVKQNALSGAFAASYDVLTKVQFLVPGPEEVKWFLPFYEAYTEAAYSTAHYDTMEASLQRLKEAGYDELVCFDLWILRLKALGSQERYQEAFELFLHLADLIDLRAPRRLSLVSVLPLIVEVLVKTGMLSEEKLRHLPPNSDPLAARQAKLLFAYAPLAFFSSPIYNVFLNLFGAKLSLRRGLFDATPFFLIATGIMASGLGNKTLATRIAEKGIWLMEQMKYTANAPANYFIYYSFLYFWVHRQHEMPERLSRAYELSVSRGDGEYAAYALMVMSLHQWLVGTSLSLSREYIRQNVQTIHGLGQQSQETVTRLCLQLVDNLVGNSPDPTLLEGEWYSENTFRPIHEQERDLFILRYLILYKMILTYLFEKYELSYQISKTIPAFDPSTRSTPAYILYVLFTGLTASHLASSAPGSHRREFLRWITRAEKLYREWAKLSQENYTPGWHLLRAELFKTRKKPWHAVHAYGQAIEAAHTSGYRLYEAIAFERRAELWSSLGETLLAEQDMAHALAIYQRWGAAAKTRWLLSRYPGLFSKIPGSPDVPTHTLTATSTQTVDLVTIVKASEALMSETDVNTLLVRILTMVVENAGAEKGVFLYETRESLMVRAIKNPGQEAEAVLMSFEEYADMPQRVIQYALQKDEELVVEDAQEESLFTSDPYVRNHLIRSMLLIPVYRTGQRVGIVYLENNLGKGMFTRDRVQTLRILLAQASLALQNVELLNQIRDTTRLETEMHLAQEMQLGLLPKNPVLPGYEVKGFMKTADEVGGDYYDIIGDTTPAWVIIGDVSGHGFPSGQVMAMTQTAIQVLVREDPTRLPTDLLRLANQALTYNITNIFENELKYVTITALQVWQDGKILYAGQHQEIWVFRQTTGEVESFSTDGLWLGIDDTLGRPQTNQEIHLQPGDVMLLYTDGLTEARQNNDLVGDRAKSILQTWGSADLSRIHNAILEFLDTCTLRDDVTFVLIRRQ